jgi:hypothetical protein
MSKLRNAFTLASIVIASAAWGAGTPVSAQDVRYIATHGAWSSFRAADSGGPVCYAASEPTQMRPANVRHGDIYLLVTDRPAEDSSDVVSLVVGYPYKTGSDVTATIGDHRFRLFTKGNTAWSISTELDHALVAAMKAGATMLVKAVSARGTDTAYTFSLSGVTAALQEVETVCEA